MRSIEPCSHLPSFYEFIQRDLESKNEEKNYEYYEKREARKFKLGPKTFNSQIKLKKSRIKLNFCWG